MASRVTHWLRWVVRLLVYWLRVAAGFVWFHTGKRVHEVVLNRQVSKFLQVFSDAHAAGQTEFLNQLQIWCDDYQRETTTQRPLTNAKITTTLLVVSPQCRGKKELKRQLQVSSGSASVSVIRRIGFSNAALVLVNKLRMSRRIGVGPIRRIQIAKALLQNPLVFVDIRYAFKIKINWNDSNKPVSDSGSTAFKPLYVAPFSDVFSRTLASAVSSTTETTVLHALTRVVVGERSRGVLNPFARVGSTSLHQLLMLQLHIKCERLLEELRPVVRSSPYVTFVDYLLRAESMSSEHLRQLQQVVPSSDMSQLSNLVSRSQFKSREAVTLRDVEIWHERFIVSDSRLIVTENGADCRSDSVAGLWPYVFGGPTNDGRVLVARGSVEKRSIESAIAGFGRADSNWFHFVSETLPRVMRAVDHDDSNNCILIQSDLPPSGRQALQALTHRELIELGDQTVHVGELHVGIGTSSTMDTPFRGDLVGNFDNESLIDTRNRLLAAYPPAEGSGRRIFMLRKSNYRRVTNFRSLRRILLRYDFEPVDMLELSLQKQIETMQQCEVVVTQGGAAMTNLMFARPGTKLIGLVGPTGTQDRYWSNYLNVFDIQSTFLIGHSRKTKRPPVIHDNFSVDTTKFEECLSQLA